MQYLWIIAIYIAFFDAKKSVKKQISTVHSNPQETCDETEEADKGKFFFDISGNV